MRTLTHVQSKVFTCEDRPLASMPVETHPLTSASGVRRNVRPVLLLSFQVPVFSENGIALEDRSRIQITPVEQSE